MNLPEFKAWFEGFTENISGVPNKKQWERICERVEQIEDSKPVTERVFIDRYIRPYYPQPYWDFRWGTPTWSLSNTSKATDAPNWQSSTMAFNQLGMADAKLISA